VRAIPSKIPATKIPSTTAAKTQTEVTPNRAAVLKKKRAEDQLAKHKARMQAKRNEQSGGKMDSLHEQRAKAHKKTAGRRVKDWDAIHAKQFAKQESLVDHVQRKNALKTKSTPQSKPTPQQQKPHATEPTPKASPVVQASPGVRASPNVQRTIVGGKVVVRHVAKSIRGGAGKGGTKYKPYTGVVKPLPKVHAKLTPVRSKENTAPKKFDLKASLAKKPSWEVKKGKVKQFRDTTKIPNTVMETTG